MKAILFMILQRQPSISFFEFVYFNSARPKSSLSSPKNGESTEENQFRPPSHSHSHFHSNDQIPQLNVLYVV